MLILGDETHDRGRIPWVTFVLIAFNMLVFCAQFRFGERMTNGWALVPKEITEFRDLTAKQPVKVHGPRDVHIDDDGNWQVQQGTRVHMVPHYPGPFPIVLTLVSYMFLHGDIFHLIFNLWFLAIFGRNVECSMDHGRFLGFYIFCGVMAGLSQVGADYQSVVPIVGASGAIAGVMGAYLAIFPWNNIKVFFGGWVGFAMGIIEVPAFIVIGFWFLMQYMMGVLTMNADFSGGTAYWCHIGGFVVGFGSVKAFVMYLHHQIRLLKAEDEAERGDEPPLPDDALKMPEDGPTPAQLDAMLDPVLAFKKARLGVFRDTKDNDPFVRPGLDELLKDDPLPAELIDESEDIAHAVTATPPRRAEMASHGIKPV